MTDSTHSDHDPLGLLSPREQDPTGLIGHIDRLIESTKTDDDAVDGVALNGDELLGVICAKLNIPTTEGPSTS